MKRRAFALSVLVGSSGCLRTVQSGNETATASTDERSATESATRTATQAGEGTATPSPAKPTGFARDWNKNGSTGLTAFRNETLFAVYGGVTAFAPDGSERWSRNLAGTNYKGLFLGPERLYVPTQIGVLHCFDPSNGDELWRQRLPENGKGRSVPVVFGSTVVINSREPDQHVAVDAETGEVRWTQTTDAIGIQNRLPIPGGTPSDASVFVDVCRDEIAVLDRDGSVMETESAVQPTTPPTFEEEAVYVGGHSTIGKLELPDANPLWTTSVPSKGVSKPLVTEEHVVLGTVQNGVFAFNKSDGSEAWHADIGPIRWSPVHYRGNLYTGTDDGTCHVLDPQTGESVLSANIGVANLTMPSVGDDALYYVGGKSAADIIRTDISYES